MIHREFLSILPVVNLRIADLKKERSNREERPAQFQTLFETGDFARRAAFTSILKPAG
jgi:hypothetical protein